MGLGLHGDMCLAMQAADQERQQAEASTFTTLGLSGSGLQGRARQSKVAGSCMAVQCGIRSPPLEALVGPIDMHCRPPQPASSPTPITA